MNHSDATYYFSVTFETEDYGTHITGNMTDVNNNTRRVMVNTRIELKNFSVGLVGVSLMCTNIQTGNTSGNLHIQYTDSLLMFQNANYSTLMYIKKQNYFIIPVCHISTPITVFTNGHVYLSFASERANATTPGVESFSGNMVQEWYQMASLKIPGYLYVNFSYEGEEVGYFLMSQANASYVKPDSEVTTYLSS